MASVANRATRRKKALCQTAPQLSHSVGLTRGTEIESEGQRLCELSHAIRESSLKRLRLVPRGAENWRLAPATMSFADIAQHLIDADRALLSAPGQPCGACGCSSRAPACLRAVGVRSALCFAGCLGGRARGASPGALRSGSLAACIGSSLRGRRFLVVGDCPRESGSRDPSPRPDLRLLAGPGR